MLKDIDVYAVILVGGKGKRLAPVSTNSTPKAFLSVTRDNKTMFRKTFERIRRIIPSENILVAANKAHSGLVRHDLPDIDKKNLVLEPVSRNTAPAITLAAFRLKERSKDAVMVVLPVDQYVEGARKYLDSVKSGIGFVKDNNGAIVILAVRPRSPQTGFGYLKIKDLKRGAGGKKIFKVEKFVEKPDLDTAKEYFKDGRFLWNTGGFIFKVDSILDSVRRYAPKIFYGLKNSNGINLNKEYEELPDISIDYAVMEKAEGVWCVCGSYGWHDMGSLESIKEILKKESRDFVGRGTKKIKVL